MEKLNGRTYAFIGFERVGGVVTYDVTNPTAPVLVDYVDNRDFAAQLAGQEADDDVVPGPESGDPRASPTPQREASGRPVKSSIV